MKLPFYYLLSGRKTILKILRKYKSNQDGVALLLTLSIITIFLSVTLEMNRRVRNSIQSSITQKTQANLLEIAESGLTIGKAILLKDAAENSIDSAQEDWANPKKLKEIINSLGFNSDELELSISDELGKIQVNAMLKSFPGNDVNQSQIKIWNNLLSFFISKDKSEDERDSTAIINCLIDWMDSGDDDAISGISGAESDYYESLTIPYHCNNHDFYDLSVIFQVKGISSDLFEKTDGFKNILPDQYDAPIEFKMGDLISVFGVEHDRSAAPHRDKKKYIYPGKININTASIPVIAALLPFGKQDFAKKIDAFRTEKPNENSEFTNNLNMKGWYANVAGLTKNEKKEMDKILVYSSHIFSIQSRVSIDNRTLILKNFISRQKKDDGKWECKVLRRIFQ